MADLGGYAAIVPGRPEKSELVRRITTNDPDRYTTGYLNTPVYSYGAYNPYYGYGAYGYGY